MKLHYRAFHLQILSVAIILVNLAPAALRAQFKPPTPDELSMTSDPKAPGAAAVILDYSDDEDDDMHVRIIYEKIKILTEKGKEYATVDVMNFGVYHVKEIKARTIHSDGTVIPLEGKIDELLVSKSGENKLTRKVFNLPSVEVGSIIEYRYTLRNENYNYEFQTFMTPFWNVQRSNFIRKAHYRFLPSHHFRFLYVTKLPQGFEVKYDASGAYSLDITDIPARPNESYMPPDTTVQYRVEFYYSDAHSAKEYWDSALKQWSKDVDHFAEHENILKGIAASLVSPSDSELDKAQKLYKAVQALDNTDFSHVKSESELHQLGLHVAKRAEDTWNQKSGSREDITLLYLALLRAVGLQAYDMKVVNRNEGTFDFTYFSIRQLDDDLVLAKIDGKDTLLDPGEKICPFSLVHWKHSGATGFRQSDSGPVGATTPMSSYKDNTFVRNGDLTLDASGAITGTINYAFNGQRALYWRQLALRNDVDEVKLQFDNDLRKSLPNSIQAHVDHFINLDNADTALFAVVKVSGNYGTATQKRMLLPSYLFVSADSHPFVADTTRQTPVDMHYAEQIQDKIILHLPPHYKLEALPSPANDSWAGHAILTTQVKADEDTVVLLRTLARAFTLAKPEEYQDLRNFYLKAAATDQQQLVLSTEALDAGK